MPEEGFGLRLNEGEEHSLRRKWQSVGPGVGRIDLDEVLGLGAGTKFHARRVADEIMTSCSEIRPHLYIGGEQVLNCRQALTDRGIANIINLNGTERTYRFVEGVAFTTFFLPDDVDQDILCLLYDACDIIDNGRKQNEATLIHCKHGISRAPSLCIAYLIVVEGLTFDDAFAELRKVRPIADPNPGFALRLRELSQWYTGRMVVPRLFHVELMNPEKTPAFYVPRRHRLSIDSFDSQSWVIVETKNEIVLWSGRLSDPSVEPRAREIADQLRRGRDAAADRWDWDVRAEVTRMGADEEATFAEKFADLFSEGASSAWRAIGDLPGG